jgi:phage tail protein X
MKTVFAANRQSIWDLANQEYGHCNGVLQLMLDNPGVLDFENSVPEGTAIKIDETKIINKTIADYIQKKGYKPATAQDGDNLAFSSGFSLGFR